MESSLNIREAVVLLILKGLEERNLSPVGDQQLQQLVRDAQPQDDTAFRFLDKPVSFSFDLQRLLNALKRRSCVNELTFSRSGWVSHPEYQLSFLGSARARETIEELEATQSALPSKINKLLDTFAASFIPPRESRIELFDQR